MRRITWVAVSAALAIRQRCKCAGANLSGASDSTGASPRRAARPRPSSRIANIRGD